MNYLLYINRKYIFVVTILILIPFLSFTIFKFLNLSENINNNLKIKIATSDIIEPRFAITNNKEKIFITAKEGYFVGNEKILLEKNVRFTSNNFSIASDNVTFDRNNQTAISNDKSIFKTKNTMITSEGFNIYDKGNKINFYGKTNVILKWEFFLSLLA